VPEIIDDDELRDYRAPGGDQRRGVARIEAFSDGVFAIAITLLVLAVEVPSPSDVSKGDLGSAIGDLGPDILAFVIGFFVIGLFWVQHHAFFGDVERHSGGLLWGNLLVLLLIAAMPFSTGLLGEYGDTRTATIIFAANVGLGWFANLLLDWIAVRDGLLNPRSRLLTEGWLRPWEMATPLAFVLSIPLSFVSVELAQWTWALSLLSIRDH
jgi:uncharacterized membrane protein